MNYLKNIIFYLATGFILSLISNELESILFQNFLYSNIVLILITLMAVNTATSSLVITKLQEIAKEYNKDFQQTYGQLRMSLVEQIILVVLASLILILYDGKVFMNFEYRQILFDTLITGVFVYAIDILRDTGQAIFEIIKVRE